MSDQEAFSTRSEPDRLEYRSYRPFKDLHVSDSLQESYGPLRRHFKAHPHRYGWYQRWLNHAGWGTTYDVYLERTVIMTAAALVIGTILGFLGMGLAIVADVVSITLAWMIGIALFLGLLGGVSVGGAGIMYPLLIARRRAQVIDNLLPHAVVLMRAESHIDPNPIVLIRDVAQATDAYGELSREFQTIRKDVELFNDNLLQAIANTHDTSPSESLRELFDDFSSHLESGGEIKQFLDQEVSQQLSNTEERFDDMIRQLTTLAPVYIMLVSIGPVILIVTLLVLSIIGANVMWLLAVLIYVGLPLIILLSATTLNELTRAYRIPHEGRLETPGDDSTAASPDSPDPWFDAYQRKSRIHRLLAPLRASTADLVDHPRDTLWVTGPVAVLLIFGAVLTGTVAVSVEAFLTRPVTNTFGLVIAPFLIMGIPLMTLHELYRRRTRSFEARFPDVLYSLASANRRGVPVDEGIMLVADRYSGTIAEEFRTVHHDVQFDDDIRRALTNLANRFHRLPRITMTIAVLRNIIRSDEDLSDSLVSLADELETRLALERRRRQEMKVYSVIVAMGVLIFLLIVVILDVLLLPQIPELGDQPLVGEAEAIDHATYHMFFFHSAILLAAGSGFMMGKLTEDTFIGGLKYVIGLIGLVVVTFVVLGTL